MSELFFIPFSGIGRAFSTGIVLVLLSSAFPESSVAQNTTVPAASYTSPSISTSTGETTPGLGGGPTQREISMMQIRSAAQDAQREAAAATMAISADRAIEERNRQSALEAARETKRLKRDAATRMKWEKAQNAYNKVSTEQMSTWKDTAGNVRVERNVPNEFMLALRAEEEAIAARNAETEPEKKGFGPLRATKKALSWRPFSDLEEPRDPGLRVPDSKPLDDDSGGGFMSNIRAPRLPFLGRRSQESDYESAPQVTVPASAPVSSNAGAAPAASIAVSKPGSVPRISGAALVDGRSSGVNVGAQPQRSAPPVEEVRQPTAPVDTPSFSSESSGQKKGLFSMFKSDRSGRKSRSANVDSGGGIDAGLFPENAVNSAPTGGSLSGNYSAEMESPQEVAASSTGDLELPGQSAGPEKKKFSFPKPNISIPKVGEAVSERRTTNSPSLGTGYYVISNQAQFMQYGESQMESEVRALPAGAVVRLTKPGADWATVQLSDGSSGVLQTKNLRPASSGEIPSQFSAPSGASDGGGSGY